MHPPLRYRHTPFATAIVVPLLLVAVLAAGVGVLTGVTSIAAIGPALMAGFLALFYALTVEIDAIHPSFRFGIGPIRQRIPLAAIADARLGAELLDSRLGHPPPPARRAVRRVRLGSGGGDASDGETLSAGDRRTPATGVGAPSGP